MVLGLAVGAGKGQRVQAAQGPPGFRFDKQAEAVQGQGQVQAGREQFVQGGLHLCRQRCVEDAGGQGVVKAKLLKHIRMAPECQVLPFVPVQAGGPTTGHLAGAQGGAEPVEMAYAQGGEHLHRLRVANRSQAEKVIQGGDGQGRQVDGPASGPPGHHGDRWAAGGR